MLTAGQKDERKATGKILSELMYNSLAKNISWAGSNGSKIEFKNTKICQLVFSKFVSFYLVYNFSNIIFCH